MDAYATHLPSLHAAVPCGAHAVEFGCGIYSTPFLLSRCAALMSVEQTSAEWIGKVREITGFHRKWAPVFAPGSDFLSVDYPDRIDIAFVDGLPSSRWACVLLMMQMRVPVVIAHDTEKPYGWQRIRHPRYLAETSKALTPWTTIWKRV